MSETVIDVREWTGAKRAAAQLDVTQQWIRQLGEQGTIRTIDTDIGRLYYRPDIERYGEERSRRGTKKVAA